MRDQRINRREFIVRSAAGLVTAGLGVHSVRPAGAEEEGTPKLVYRTLGKTNLRIPVVSFGVMNSDSPDLLRKALDLGIKHLDTAHRYLRGNSEQVIGKILEERKCRDKVYVATKMYFDRDKEKKIFTGEGEGGPGGASQKNFDDQLATSLNRLRTDYVDILYLHSCVGPLMPSYEPMLEAFVKGKEAGKVRFIGITTHADEPETIRAAADAGVWDVVLTAYNFMQEHTDEVQKAIHYAAEKGVGIIAMKTQGGVRLNQEKKIQVNHAAALKWALSNKNVCTAIPGITTFEQMDLDFGVMKNLSLTDEEERELKISSLLPGSFYCRQCRSCIPSCPHKVEIPSLMRAYMYAEAYGNLMQAEMTVNDLPRKHGLSTCQDCETCTAACRHGIRISERLRTLRAMNLLEKGSA